MGGACAAGDLVGTEKGEPGLEIVGVNTVVPEGPTRTLLAVDEFAVGIIDAPKIPLPPIEFDARFGIDWFTAVDPITGILVEATVPPTWRPAVEAARIAPPWPIVRLWFVGWEIVPVVEAEMKLDEGWDTVVLTSVPFPCWLLGLINVIGWEEWWGVVLLPAWWKGVNTKWWVEDDVTTADTGGDDDTTWNSNEYYNCKMSHNYSLFFI